MNTYEITVERTEVTRAIVRVTAASQKEAEELTYEQADFSRSEVLHADERILTTKEITP